MARFARLGEVVVICVHLRHLWISLLAFIRHLRPEKSWMADQVRHDGARTVSGKAYLLDTLLDQMKPETFPDEIDFGPPAGQEIW